MIWERARRPRPYDHITNKIRLDSPLVESKKQSRFDASIEFYQSGKVTLGRASELAGMHRCEFGSALKERGIFKLVEVDSVEILKEGVSAIKSCQKDHGNAEE